MLTSAQREWVHAHELLLHVKPEKRGHRPTSWWRVLSYDIVHVRARCRRAHPLLTGAAQLYWFDSIVLIGIVCNSIVMGMPYFGESVGYRAFLDNANIVFVFLFVAEAALKISGLGMTYFVGTCPRCAPRRHR